MLQTIAIRILPNISQSKHNHTMKFGQFIEYNKRNIFLKKKSCRNWDTETSSRPLSAFWKSFIWGRSKWSAAWFLYILIALNLAYNKSKLHKTFDYWSRDMLNFKFLEKVLGIVAPPHFLNDFSTKMFPMLYSIEWPKFIVWLPILLEIKDKMCIGIVC